MNEDWVDVCEVCNLRFPCKSALLLHRRWEHGEDAEPEKATDNAEQEETKR
ncbi:MAG: hypothetical protein M1503_10715 [Thaumarchaeota archaeon]|nr:hypothetical protein [Nitrososphaerota archaeon]MCL5318713.1 hypothetical protein [Nitrososphaerota archaeon]